MPLHDHPNPSAPAVIMASGGQRRSFAELDRRSKNLAATLQARGIGRGGHVAVLLANQPEFFDVAWATQRSGLYLTPVNWHLAPAEAGYIIEDSGAQALITSVEFGPLMTELAESLTNVEVKLVAGGELEGFDPFEDAVADTGLPAVDPELEGAWMFYSSGTTGRPKGIEPPLTLEPFGTGPRLEMLLRGLYGFTEDTVYLSPAPLYHAAPLGWSTTTQRIGGSVVVMERFDPLQALRLIEEHRITHVQFVPTHFVRMLKLTDEERNRYDLSSLQTVVHAAAPCPPEVKKQMLDWFGPKIYEYYAGSEGTGFCAIGPDEWLAHVGSVGRAIVGVVHALDEDGNDVPTGETGQLWFETDVHFEYHNDPTKTAAAFNARGMSTIGDIGHVDEEGYVYLSDRVGNMIISGGVNIYPREIEDVLIMHPSVDDVAVIGVPDAEMGESVKAFVQPAPGAEPGEELAAELIAYARQNLSSFKCPRSVGFVEQLPRLPTGKLLKRNLVLDQTGS
ncbi:MAG: acyl-CoA synthetase [Ilumatobacteraceae bacterium]